MFLVIISGQFIEVWPSFCLICSLDGHLNFNHHYICIRTLVNYLMAGSIAERFFFFHSIII